MDEKQSERFRKQFIERFAFMLGECSDDLRATLPIYATNTDDLVQDRTGVLFAVGNKHFILTAAHDLMAYVKNRVALYTSPPTQGGLAVPLAGVIHGNEDVDMAIMLLSDKTVELLGRERKYLRITDLDLVPKQLKTFYAIIGYPIARSSTDLSTIEIASRHYVFGAIPYEGVPKTGYGYSPRVNIALQHGNYVHNIANEQTEPLRLHGMSGCGIWRLTSGDAKAGETWHPSDRRLVAIQISYKHGDFVKGVWIGYATQLINMYYPDCREALELFLA